LGETGLGTPIAYDPAGQPLGGDAPLTAHLGAIVHWSQSAGAGTGTNAWSGTLTTGQAATLAFAVRESEIASTVHVPGGQGAVLLALESQLPEDAHLEVAGAQIIGTATANGKVTRLLRVSEAGVKLIRITGNGAAQLRLTLAGDLNSDGQVDGTDSALWEAARAAQDPRADLTGDGLINPADRQVLTTNTGFVANRAPQTQTPLPTLKTHTDLGLTRALAGLAEDLEGDPIYWRILGATHGSAKLNADGQTLAFTPEPGYTGEATITVQADDGFATGAPIELTVQISDSKLINLHIARIAVLATGAARSLRITGDFADQQGVELDTHYVQVTSSDPATVFLDTNGRIVARRTGTVLLSFAAQGIVGANAMHVADRPKTPLTDEIGNELDLFPPQINLAARIGQRQIDVHAVTEDGTLGSDATAKPDLIYFVSDPTVASVSAEGLIKAKAPGVATVTVIQGAKQGTIQLRVVEPVTGPSRVDAKAGAVVQDGEGNALMIAAGALPKDVTASIATADLDTLDIPRPASEVLRTLGAVQIAIDGVQATHPMQLALKVTLPVNPINGQPEPLAVGSKVLFWRWGEITLADGSTERTWWLVDDGVIGDDGLAHTASPPYSGPAV